MLDAGVTPEGCAHPGARVVAAVVATWAGVHGMRTCGRRAGPWLAAGLAALAWTVVEDPNAHALLRADEARAILAGAFVLALGTILLILLAMSTNRASAQVVAAPSLALLCIIRITVGAPGWSIAVEWRLGLVQMARTIGTRHPRPDPA